MKKINRNKKLSKREITKTFSIMLMISLLLTTISGSVIGKENSPDTNDGNTKIIIETFSFSDPEISKSSFTSDKMNENFIQLDMKGTNSYISKAGEPKLPKYRATLEIPFGATVNNLEISHSSDEIMTLPAKIEPAPTPQPLNYEAETAIATGLMRLAGNILSKFPQKQNIKDVPSENSLINEETYKNNKFSPENHFDYNIRVGLNNKGEHATFVITNLKPVRYSPEKDTIKYVKEIEVKLSYNEPIGSTSTLSDEDDVDLLILTAKKYQSNLKNLVEHKTEMGLETRLFTLNEIYSDDEFDVSDGRDNQEKIKLFIKEAVKEWNVTYVLLVGGYRTFFGLNRPDMQFPVRYANVDDDAEDGYVSDLYYSDIYRYDGESGFAFETWDSNCNDKFSEWNWYGMDEMDLLPDVYVGRLACRNNREVKTIVNKIINYETGTYGEDWFEKMIVITGDGFQDQPDLGHSWDISDLPDGEYTIHAQSALLSDSSVKGPIDVTNITIDRTKKSNITFSEEDHLKIESIDEDQESLYPAKPVAEITSPSEGNTLGNTNVYYIPTEAYIGDRWARVEYYASGEMIIRGKSYDPQPQTEGDNGSHTRMHVWITNTNDEIVYEYDIGSDLWYEGEMETLKAMNYMPDDFEYDILWPSNGKITGQEDVIDAISKGSGFIYFGGHGNPMTWANHYPGIPGGRRNGDFEGLSTFQMNYPFFPMNKLRNRDKLPVLLVGGCHNSMFDTSLMKLFYNPTEVLHSVKHGSYAFECWSWWLIRVPHGGAIATIGCSGLGYGLLGEHCVKGLGGWINPEFFRQYAEEGFDILGETFCQTLGEYVQTFSMNDKTNVKTVQEWILLGDPSLKIGGYDTDTLADNKDKDSNDVLSDQDSIQEENRVIYTNPTPSVMIKTADVPIQPVITNNLDFQLDTSSEDWQLTNNPLSDTSPSMVSSGSKFLVGYVEEVPFHDSTTTDAALAFSNGGVGWTRLLPAWAGEQKYVSVDSMGPGDGAYAMFGNQGSNTYIMILNDITDPSTWSTIHWGEWILNNVGKNGIAVCSGYPHETDWVQGHWIAGLITDIDYDDEHNKQSPAWFLPIYNEVGHGSVFWYDLENCANISGDIDPDTLMSHWAFETSGNSGMLSGFYCDHEKMENQYYDSEINHQFKHPDVAAAEGYVYVAYEDNNAIHCYVSSNDGYIYTDYTVATTGTNPRIVIDPNGDVQCYYVRNGEIYSATSTDHGVSWYDNGKVGDAKVSNENYPFDVSEDGLVWEATDGDLYAEIFDMQSIDDALVRNILTPSKRRVTATIINSGTTTLDEDAEWEIKVNGTDHDYYFGFPFFRGRVWLGFSTSGSLDLEPGENKTVISTPIFGFGFVDITVMVKVDDEIISSQTEDGFLIGGNVLLDHGKE